MTVDTTLCERERDSQAGGFGSIVDVNCASCGLRCEIAKSAAPTINSHQPNDDEPNPDRRRSINVVYGTPESWPGYARCAHIIAVL